MELTTEIIHCSQTSKEWHHERAGLISASMYGMIQKKVDGLSSMQALFVDHYRKNRFALSAAEHAGYANPSLFAQKAFDNPKIVAAIEGNEVGDFSTTAKDYAFQLAIERISGEPLDEGHETWAMARGKELEPEARSLHELRTGKDIDEIGLIRTTDKKFGASPDGLMDPDDGCEYKCFLDPKKIREIILDHNIEEFKPQCYGGLWLSGRSVWHFGLYCPALREVKQDLVIHKVDRDESYIENMERVLWEFDGVVEEYKERLIEAGDRKRKKIVKDIKSNPDVSVSGIFGGRRL